MSADSRSAQKWKGMVIGMDKKEAAQKLMSIFGNCLLYTSDAADE